MKIENIHRNNLDQETSPYLLQHKDNPVWWQPWSDEVLFYAKEKNKPILVSIGYSACHWCHVMEHESFQDFHVAEIMNKNFICIKVDREERPDIDAVYMDAVQAMNGQGGWPLNCFILPDQKPIYGGTYFPKDKWIQILQGVSQLVHKDTIKAKDYANKLLETLQNKQKSQTIHAPIGKNEIHRAVDIWKQTFDRNWGGTTHMPKFMTPIAWNFLLMYGHIQKDDEVLKQVKLTLDRMAQGGIFDTIAGGFSRYSTDPYWKIPHFEKMLYDNAQLLSLYANGYRKYKSPEYRLVIEKTISWLTKEMLDHTGAFYTALDADSDGEEGKFYTWTTAELETLLKEEFPLFAAYYNIDKFGLWEGDTNVLIRLETDLDFTHHHAISIEELSIKKENWINILESKRKERNKPALDDKILSSWNALLVIGLCDAAMALDNSTYLDLAQKILYFLLHTQCKQEIIYHNYKNEQSTIPGFLDDYANLIAACIKAYECTLDETYLIQAKKWTDIAIKIFLNEDKNLFYYKSLNDKQLIHKTIETHDSVTPSSNAMMLSNLVKIYQYFNDKNYYELAQAMITRLRKQIISNPVAHALWLTNIFQIEKGLEEIVINSRYKNDINKKLQQEYIPHFTIAATAKNSLLPLTQNKYQEKQELFYHCVNQQCNLPKSNYQEIINL